MQEAASKGEHAGKVSVWERGRRLMVVLAVALSVGFALKWVGQRLDQRQVAAGFGQGFFQGASMPLALPTLLTGVDVTIYAVNNTGVTYKIGYILGITGCGAFFFGTVYGQVGVGRRRS